MTTDTNKLLAQTSAETSGADLLRLWSQQYGGEVSLTLTNLKAWLDANDTSTTLTTQYASPSATGFSVTVNYDSAWLVLTPAAGYAAGTLVLPLSPADKSELLVNSTQAVTALTIDGNGASGVVGAPTGLSANGFFRLRYDGQSYTWYRVG